MVGDKRNGEWLAMNWLDKYIRDKEDGYLLNEEGGLFVEIGNGEYMRHAAFDNGTSDVKTISKDEFLERLVKGEKA